MSAKVLLLVMLACVAYVGAQQMDYGNRMANIDVDAILKNKRVLQGYINCILETGPCTPEGRDVKKHLPEAYKTNCGKCNEEQKKLMKKTVKAFIANNGSDWDKIIDKYDPKREHEQEFLKFINEQ